MDQQFSRYSRSCHILIVWALAMTLPLKIAHQSFCLHSGSWLGITIPSLVTKCWAFWPFTVTLTMNAVILWRMMMYHQTKFGCQGINSSEDIVEKLIFWSLKPLLWSWPWRLQTIFFQMTLLLMMLHHHTKFGNKMFCSSEDIIRTNIHWHFEPLLWPWPWMQLSNFFHNTLWLMKTDHQTKFGCQGINSSEDTAERVRLPGYDVVTHSLEDWVEIVTFWLFKPLLWPWY